jgi:hypothetical protein
VREAQPFGFLHQCEVAFPRGVIGLLRILQGAAAAVNECPNSETHVRLISVIVCSHDREPSGKSRISPMRGHTESVRKGVHGNQRLAAPCPTQAVARHGAAADARHGAAADARHGAAADDVICDDDVNTVACGAIDIAAIASTRDTDGCWLERDE